eukprot:COSAG01_NODE_52778_length_344_cov_0.661224_1_plen_49_part_01
MIQQKKIETVVQIGGLLHMISSHLVDMLALWAHLSGATEDDHLVVISKR